MGAMRNLNLKIGFVNAAVEMHKATNDDRPFSFRKLHKKVTEVTDAETGEVKEQVEFHPINLKTVCSVCTDDQGNRLELSDTCSGYEYAKGQYVEVTENEKDSVAVESNGAILLQYTRPMADLWQNPMYLSGNVYYLIPSKKVNFNQEFALIREVLLARNETAICRVCLYGRERTVAIVPGHGCLLMFLLRYPAEIRAEPPVALPQNQPDHVGLMNRIMESFAGTELRLDYEDRMAIAMTALIDGKVSGQEVLPAQEAQVQAKPSSLMDSMKATLAALDAKRAELAESTPAEQPKKKAAKKGKVA